MKYKNIYDLQRKSNLLHRVLLDVIMREENLFFDDFNISRLKLQNDLKQCRVFYTFFKTKSKDEIKNLNFKLNLQGKIWRQKMAKKWPFRTIPKLIFIYDQSLIELEKITEFFAKNKS